MLGDISDMLREWYDVVLFNQIARAGHDNVTVVNITVTAHACCICDTAGAPETTTLLEPPCSSVPPQFMVTDASFSENLGSAYVRQTNFGKFPEMSTEALEKLADCLGNVSTPAFASVFQNVFQAIYHLLRVDLGVILNNQIYNSPQMFSLSIMPVIIPGYPSLTNQARVTISNPTLMAQWRQRVAFFQTSDRVPIMDYLQPVPRLKPLGSAITSEFVSTFAMLSALWTIFSLGAGALARRTALARQQLFAHPDSEETIYGESNSGWDMGTSTSFAFHKEPSPAHNVENDMRRMKHDMGGMKHDMREMKRTIRLLLEKQGLADDRLDHDLKANPNVKDGILSPLVHRRSSSSNRA
ncbi:hypothetical protein DFH08DRAFT_449121 [Mycena albidolilacea]|uniref:Uncharacterized protein n=1 Tax=Mycena albidolilacea TaxID=1033008 RepID=A0AAD6Z848_9AGAR|nr:hypothetical protein DFH08DRAFT_449121 [Mycena albidolilacea]